MRKFHILFMFVAVIAMSFLASCGGGDDPAPAPEPTPNLTGLAISQTGSLFTNTDITFSASVTAGTITAYTWSVKDITDADNPEDVMVSNNTSENFVFNTSTFGDFEITLTATGENDETETISSTITVTNDISALTYDFVITTVTINGWPAKRSDNSDWDSSNPGNVNLKTVVSGADGYISESSIISRTISSITSSNAVTWTGLSLTLTPYTDAEEGENTLGFGIVHDVDNATGGPVSGYFPTLSDTFVNAFIESASTSEEIPLENDSGLDVRVTIEKVEN